MNEQWQKWTEQFSELQDREKKLAFAVGLFLIAYLFVWFGIAPLHKSLNKSDIAIEQAERKLAGLAQQQQMISDALTRDYLAEVKAQITQKQEEIKNLDEQLAAFSSSFVSPKAMPNLLRKMLKALPKLRIAQFELLPAKAIHIGQEDEKKVAFYQHDLTLTVEGGFFDLMDYAKKINALEEKVFIQDFDYKVLDYPKAELKLIISTISSNEKAIEL